MSSSIALKEDSKDYAGYGFNCFHIILYAILAKLGRHRTANPT